MRAWIGIDPGASGAAFALFEDGSYSSIRFSKATDRDIFMWFSDLSIDHKCVCVKEKVWAMPATNSDGTSRGMGAQTSFVFGEGNGFIRGMLVACSIPFEEKVPQTWQKIYGLKKDKNEAQPSFKKRLRERAEQLYPAIKLTADTADALLIAHFCKTIMP